MTSRKVTASMYRILRSYFSKSNTLKLFSILFLPGTFMHEASHYLIARILFVRAGDFNLKPEYQNDGMQMGSISIAKTDPLRRFVIGIAPVVLGTAVVLFLSYMIISLEAYWQKIIIAFFVFTVVNSMFSSKKDMEGAVKLFITVTIFMSIFYFLGVEIKLQIPESFLNKIDEYITTAVYWLAFPLLINFVFVLLSRSR